MKKQELIHLHGLLSEVSARFEEWDDAQLTLDEYDSLGVRPTSLHKSKTDHKEAVFSMADELAAEMDEETRKTPVTAD